MRTNHALCVINTFKMLATSWMVRESNPVRARISAYLQTDSGANLSSGTIGTGNPSGYGLGHPPQSSSKVKERVAFYLYSHSGPSWPLLGRNFLYLYNLEETCTSNWNIFFIVGGLYLDNETYRHETTSTMTSV
jgi:hypothetical protein